MNRFGFMSNGQLLLISSLFALTSCGLFNDDPKSGCTTCHASNYDAEAVLEDGSCEFLYEDIVGTYTVKDSVMGPFSDWYLSEAYEIQVHYDGCKGDRLLIVNYGDLKNDGDNSPIEVGLKAEGDELRIINQAITNTSNNIITDYTISLSTGKLSADSIYFELSYSTRFDPFYGACWGVKKD